MATLNPKSSRFSYGIWLTLSMFAIVTLTFGLYIYSEIQVNQANELRLHSFQLADELRHSSDDLTRMVRSYIVTGNPRYKQHYQEILAIREGKKPALL